MSEPTDCDPAEEKVPGSKLVPYSNHAVVADPFGVTVPFSVAPAGDTPVAACVTAAGGNGSAGFVSRTKTSDTPFVSPATKLVASEVNATNRPSALIEAS